MKCFYHQDRDAVGICKSCERGVCAECAVDLGKGLACAGKCEDDVTALIQYLDANVRMAPASNALLRKARGSNITGAVCSLAFAAAIVAVGLWLYRGEFVNVLSMLGTVLLIFGLVQLGRALTIPRFPGYDEPSEGGAPTQKGA